MIDNLAGLGVDAGQRRAPGIADPQHVGVFVRAHAARTLRPRNRVIVGAVGEVLVEGALGFRQTGHFVLQRRQHDFGRLAGRHVGLADGVERHLRPPTIAVAVTRGAVG